VKILPEHIAHMRAAMEPLDTPERRAIYIAGNYPNAGRTQNVAMRYRWDLLYAAGLSSWGCSTVYPYANDEHIDTAMRHILGMGASTTLFPKGD
jgi:hypothetical protein